MKSDGRRRWMWSCVAVGGVLIFLGLVNAALGHSKLGEYAQVIALLDGSTVAEPETTRRRRDSAERKLAFYGTVERGGAWMAMLGAGLALLGLATGGFEHVRPRATPP